jgi:hypothetical protein
MVNTVFTYTTLTRYYRRYHQPETKLKHLAPKKKAANKTGNNITPKAKIYSVQK